MQDKYVYVCSRVKLRKKLVMWLRLLVHFMGNRWGNSGNSVRFYFFGLQNHCTPRGTPRVPAPLPAWRITRMEEPGGLQSMGLLESDTTERLHFHFSLSCIGEGNGNPLQCSCLENPRDGGWEAEFTGGGISKLPSARRDSQPACVWKPIFAQAR